MTRVFKKYAQVFKLKKILLFILFFNSCTTTQSLVLDRKPQGKIDDPEIEFIEPFSNLDKAKTLIVSWIDGNSKYIERLHQIVSQINKSEKSKISMHVSIPTTYSPEEFFSPVNRPDGEPFDNFKTWMSNKADFADTTYSVHTSLQNPWMQDFGDYVLLKYKNSEEKQGVFLDTNYYGGNLGSPDLSSIAKKLEIPLLNANNYKKNEKSTDGDRGGNIEATNTGEFLVGNTMSATLLKKIKMFSKKEPILVNTNFLLVGHVDEIYSVVPAKNNCGAALVYADPLYALSLTRQSPHKYGTLLDSYLNSLNYFLKKGIAQNKRLTVDDFDLTRAIRTKTEFKDADWSIKTMVRVSKLIYSDVQKITSKSSCLSETIPLPIVLDASPEFDSPEGENDFIRRLVPFINPINMIVLNGHAIFEKPMFEDVVIAELSKVFGDKIHLITDDDGFSAYSLGYGSTHCSTNVVREK